MPDRSTYSGGWIDGKQHGYGVIVNTRQELKFGLWKDGKKLIKMSTAEANSIQDGDYDPMNDNQIQTQLGEGKNQFWSDVAVLTNKFEPFDTFATE